MKTSPILARFFVYTSIMMKRVTLLLTMILIGIASCNNKKEQEMLAKKFNDDYKELSLVHKSMEKEQAQIQMEKDTLIKQLKTARGVFSAETEIFSEKYNGLIEKQEDLISKHFDILGDLAKLEDEVINGKYSSQEATDEHKDLLHLEKKVRKDYKNVLSIRDSLLKEFEVLKGPTE